MYDDTEPRHVRIGNFTQLGTLRIEAFLRVNAESGHDSGTRA